MQIPSLSAASNYLASFRPVEINQIPQWVLSNQATAELGSLPRFNANLEAQLAQSALGELGASYRNKRTLEYNKWATELPYKKLTLADKKEFALRQRGLAMNMAGALAGGAGGRSAQRQDMANILLARAGSMVSGNPLGDVAGLTGTVASTINGMQGMGRRSQIALGNAIDDVTGAAGEAPPAPPPLATMNTSTPAQTPVSPVGAPPMPTAQAPTIGPGSSARDALLESWYQSQLRSGGTTGTQQGVR